MSAKLNIDRYAIETAQGWLDEIALIPFIQFPQDWLVKVIPPFGYAVVKFQVKLPSGRVKSIYLDSRDSLGIVGHPYWEVHPYHGDCGRCDIRDVAELLAMIADESEGDSNDE